MGERVYYFQKVSMTFSPSISSTYSLSQCSSSSSSSHLSSSSSSAGVRSGSARPLGTTRTVSSPSPMGSPRAHLARCVAMMHTVPFAPVKTALQEQCTAAICDVKFFASCIYIEGGTSLPNPCPPLASSANSNPQPTHTACGSALKAHGQKHFNFFSQFKIKK